MSVKRFTPSPILFSLLLGLVATANVVAQQATSTDFTDIRPKQNSPLSRFGLGDPLDQFHAAQAGMGGLQATYQDAFHLNLQNPASLASLQATSFEIGLYARNSELSDASGSANTWQGNIRYIALGFPLRNPVNLSLDRLLNSWNGGMAFSLAPTTLVGYDLELKGNVDSELGSTSNRLKGTGGAYRFSWSNALRYRGLSGGVNVNYNFGKITNSRVLSFDSIPAALTTEFTEDFSISGFNIGYGLQYAFNFTELNEQGEKVANGKRILVGANGVLGGSVDTNSDLLSSRVIAIRTVGLNTIVISDTLSSQEGVRGRADLPASYTFGLAYEEVNRLYIGVEYGRQQYGSYTNDAQPETLADVTRLAAGIQYIPDVSSFGSYWEQVRYRAGVRIEDDPRTIDGEQARRNAVTVGVGMPIRLPRQQVSFLDLAVEYGKFGVPDVLDETYVQFTLGFSLNDNSWFFQRKLN